MSTTYQMDDYVPSGSCLKGHITASYDALVEAFGEPNILNAEEGDKVWNEWGIRFSEGDDDIYATIYDWKEIGPSSSRTGEYRWHVGGKSLQSLWCVTDTLEQAYPEKLHL